MSTLPTTKDPALKEFQLFWESRFWNKNKENFRSNAKFFERLILFFGDERRPRDIFRNDVAEYGEWLKKKGWSESAIKREMEYGARLYRMLNELEVFEANFNPFSEMLPFYVRHRR